jgi:hypothetical protein
MSDTVEVVQRKKLAEAQAIKLDYEEVFATPRGKKVLKDIMLSGVMERSAFSTDAMLMAANCAKQDFARHIMQMATPVSSKLDKPRKAKK